MDAGAAIVNNSPQPVAVDPMKDMQKAYTMAGDISDYNQAQKDRTSANQDEAVIKAMMQDPNYDWNTPDGVNKAVKDLQGKVSPNTYAKLQQNANKVSTDYVKTQKALSELPVDKLNQMSQLTDYVANSQGDILEGYKKAVVAKQADPNAPDPMQVFTAAKQAKAQEMSQLKDAQGNPIIDPKIIQQFAQMDPDQLKAKYTQGSLYQGLLANAAKIQKEQAQAGESAAKTTKIETETGLLKETGGKDVDPVAKVIKEKEAGLFNNEDGTLNEQLYQQTLDAAKSKAAGKGATSGMTMSPETVTRIAKQALSGDPNALKGLSGGSHGGSAANRAAIENEMTKIAEEEGLTPEQLSRKKVAFHAMQKAQDTLNNRGAVIDSAAIEMDQFIDLSKASYDKVDRGSIVPLNELRARIEKGTGSPEEVELYTNLQALANAYAVVSRRGAPVTNESMKAAEDVVNKYYSKGQFESMASAMHKEAEAAISSTEKAGEGLYGRGGFGETKNPKDNAPAADNQPKIKYKPYAGVTKPADAIVKFTAPAEQHQVLVNMGIKTPQDLQAAIKAGDFGKITPEQAMTLAKAYGVK